MIRTMACIGLCALAAPLAADPYRYTLTGMKVTETGTDRYLVSGIANFGPVDYWCTIGHYASAVLGLDQSARIYVVGNRQSGAPGITFSTSPAGTASASARVASGSINVDGASRPVNSARAECYSRNLSAGQ